jgi:hypothetical protein
VSSGKKSELGIQSLKGVLHIRDFGACIDGLMPCETAVVAGTKLDPIPVCARPHSRS